MTQVIGGPEILATPAYQRFANEWRLMFVLDQAVMELGRALAPPERAYEPGDSMRALLTRTAGWTHTLAALNAPFYLQGHAAGCRALIEIQVDIELLAKDFRRARRMLAFEAVQRLLGADELLRSPDSSELREDAIAFRREHAGAIRDESIAAGIRSDQGTHRWTGRPLDDDAKTAGVPFSRSLLRILNWGVHGSANTLFRGLGTDQVPDLAAMALSFARSAALASSRLVASEFRVLDQFELRLTWHQLERYRCEHEAIGATSESDVTT